jgi:hypothetical protein
MADVTGDGISAALIRTAFLAQTRWKAMQARTARRYMELHALSASLEMFKPGAIVPWVSYLFPTEQLTAYGLTPDPGNRLGGAHRKRSARTCRGCSRAHASCP